MQTYIQISYEVLQQQNQYCIDNRYSVRFIYMSGEETFSLPPIGTQRQQDLTSRRLHHFESQEEQDIVNVMQSKEEVEQYETLFPAQSNNGARITKNFESNVTRTFSRLNSSSYRRSNTKKRGGCCYSRMDKCLVACGHKKKQNLVDERIFYFNNHSRNQLTEQRESNYIRTTKYTITNFLPLSLILQFKREANMYFLLQAILNSIPAISAMNPITAIMPLTFVLGVSMMREGLEDYQRYKSDVQTNKQQIKFIKNGRVVLGQSKDIKVGDMLYIHENEELPADVIIVASSQPNATCFIQTSSLDGEKNLKTRKAPKDLQNIIPSGFDFDPSQLLVTGQVATEPPSGNLYSFNGNLWIGERYFSLNSEQLLLKGTQIRNTRWVVGFVVYTGIDTRIMMNTQLGGQYKQSDMEQKMNIFTIQIFIAQIILTLSIAIMGGYWHSEATEASEGNDQPVHFYIEFGYSSIIEGFLTFIRYFQLLNTLIPISLFVTAEMIKFTIAYFISKDCSMYSLTKDQGTEVKNMSIIENLGQLHYIFTDKTGTLTCNEMQFRQMCIGEKEFNPKQLEKPAKITKNKFNNSSTKVQEMDRLSQFEKELLYEGQGEEATGELEDKIVVNLTLKSENGVKQLHITSQQQLMQEFMSAMSLAHEIITENPTINLSQQSDGDDEHENDDTNKVDDKKQNLSIAANQLQNQPETEVDVNQLRYQGPSPDEVTLVEFSRDQGYAYITGDDSFAEISINRMQLQQKINNNMVQKDDDPGFKLAFDKNLGTNNETLKSINQKVEKKRLRFKVMRRIEFDSTRKRMSILLHDPRDQLYKLYIKGADSEIQSRLIDSSKAKDQNNIATEIAVKNFAQKASEEGLRTLYFAMKILDEKEVQKFEFNIHKAEQKLKQKDELLEKIYSDMERGLTLLGATAVEDRLQDQVPEVINDFQRANIKVWMLTGDKFETAKNIGFSCKLIQKGDVIYELRNKNDVRMICSTAGIKKNDYLMNQNKRRVLIVQSEALQALSRDYKFTENFIRISKTCEAVICCRVSPKQKADVVRMIKKNDLSLLTMAVGDGNNDVSMIKEAHVGVGLYGNEGLRAVQASDFAIPDFKQLWRLIFLHGRARYASITKFILYFFYKNVALTMPHYFYAYFCGYSAMTIFDEWYIQLYNVLFTAIPVILLGVFDWDLHPDIDGAQYNTYLPLLYYEGQHRLLFNMKKFFLALLQGLVHSGIIFYITIVTFQDSGILNQKTGYATDLWTSSVAIFTALVFAVNLNLILRMTFITYLHGLSILLISFGTYLGFMWTTNYFQLGWTQYAVYEAHSSNLFYLTITLSVSTCFIIDLFYLCCKVLLKTSPASYLRILVSHGVNINNQYAAATIQHISNIKKKKNLQKMMRRSSVADHRQQLLNEMVNDPHKSPSLSPRRRLNSNDQEDNSGVIGGFEIVAQPIFAVKDSQIRTAGRGKITPFPIDDAQKQPQQQSRQPILVSENVDYSYNSKEGDYSSNQNLVDTSQQLNQNSMTMLGFGKTAEISTFNLNMGKNLNIIRESNNLQLQQQLSSNIGQASNKGQNNSSAYGFQDSNEQATPVQSAQAQNEHISIQQLQRELAQTPALSGYIIGSSDNIVPSQQRQSRVSGNDSPNEDVNESLVTTNQKQLQDDQTDFKFNNSQQNAQQKEEDKEDYSAQIIPPAYISALRPSPL